MLHVVLDTSIYRADPMRSKQAFRALERLAGTGFLQIHVPYVVQREFTTQRRADLEKHCQAILSEVRALTRQRLEKKLDGKVQRLGRMMEKLKPQLALFAERDFEGWLAQVRAALHPVESDHGLAVLQSYFDGRAPFRQPKAREDLPDAFVYQVLLALKARHGELHLVVADKQLRSTCQSQGIHVYVSLDEFISSELPQGALRRDDNVKRFMAAVLKALPEFSDGFAAGIESSIIDELAGKELQSRFIEEENHEGRILMVGSPENINISHAEAEYYGEGLIMVPFELTIDCLIEYPIFKADYYSLPDEKSDRIGITDLNDHYFEAEEDFLLKVTGRLAISIAFDENGSDFKAECMEELLEDSEVKIDSIDGIEIIGEA